MTDTTFAPTDARDDDFDPSTALLSFHNEFDDVWVTCEDAGFMCEGPFTVRVTFGDRAIDTEDTSEVFTTLREAKTRFLELVAGEWDAVLGEVDPN